MSVATDLHITPTCAFCKLFAYLVRVHCVIFVRVFAQNIPQNKQFDFIRIVCNLKSLFYNLSRSETERLIIAVCDYSANVLSTTIVAFVTTVSIYAFTSSFATLAECFIERSPTVFEYFIKMRQRYTAIYG